MESEAMRRRLISRIAYAMLLVAATVADVAAQSGRVAGAVRDERGQPIKGASVTARNIESSANAVAVTDDGGLFELTAPAGAWTFTAEKIGYEAAFLDVNVGPLPTTNPAVTLTMRVAAADSAITGKDLQQRLVDADYLFNIKRWDEAIAAYRRILAEAPAMSVVNLQIAAAYRNKGEFARALSAYGDLLRADPNNDKAKVGVAMTQLEKGDLESAERALEAVAETPGATREVFYDLGEMKLSKGLTADALKAYRRAAEIDPTWGKPFFQMGRVSKDRGDLDSALTYFTKVIEVDPNSPEAEQAKTAIQQLKK
jgi:tetratricopeptide (TPR) repeat protein